MKALLQVQVFPPMCTFFSHIKVTVVVVCINLKWKYETDVQILRTFSPVHVQLLHEVDLFLECCEIIGSISSAFKVGKVKGDWAKASDAFQQTGHFHGSIPRVVSDEIRCH